MNVHFSSHSKHALKKSWAKPMSLIAYYFQNEGYKVTCDPDLLWWQEPSFVTHGEPDDDAIIIYTDCNRSVTPKKGLYVGLQGPMPGYFSIDKVGVWPNLEQTYIPIPKNVSHSYYEDDLTKFNEIITDIKESKLNQFHNPNLNLGWDSPMPFNVPDDHILLIATHFDDVWRHGWNRMGVILNTLLSEQDRPIVVKFNPEFLLTPSGHTDDKKLEGVREMVESMDDNVTLYTGLESLHDILPMTRLCILDEYVDNLEPFMYNVPIITHGAPPYRNFVKQIYHQHELMEAVNDLSWFNDSALHWLHWYMTKYLCCDEGSVNRRLYELTSKT